MFNTNKDIRAIVPKYVYECIDKEHSILDFGAGKHAIHTKWLRENGFNVTAWEFGDNFVDEAHDKNALDKQYQVVMASNVLNVNNSIEMLRKTLTQIYNCIIDGGALVCNYPAIPRKLGISANDLYLLILSVFKNGQIIKVGGSSYSPLWIVYKDKKGE